VQQQTHVVCKHAPSCRYNRIVTLIEFYITTARL
jgi:hypothetical protein